MLHGDGQLSDTAFGEALVEAQDVAQFDAPMRLGRCDGISMHQCDPKLLGG